MKLDDDTRTIAPKFHHYAPLQWCNDPIGLYRENGLWILHDQRAAGPALTSIGWGRATSRDLLDWCDEGMVIPPSDDGWIYSGSVISPPASPPTAFFTLHEPRTGLQSQCSAIWDQNWHVRKQPILPGRRDTRDPFVFQWGSEWRMILASPPPWDAPFEHRSRLCLLASTDLEAWQELGRVGPVGEDGELFETPLLRQVPVEGEAPINWPWLLAIGVVDRSAGAVCGTRGWFGTFDGVSFRSEGGHFNLDHGPDFYAPAAWSGTPPDEFVLTAWTNSWAYARHLPSNGWSGTHALPRRLTAVKSCGGWSLMQKPAALPSLGEPISISQKCCRPFSHGALILSGSGKLRMGDLSLTLDANRLLLERSCQYRDLKERGFAGRWQAPRDAEEVIWLVDGCVNEVYTANGGSWLSALSLADAQASIVTKGLTAQWRPLG